MKKLSVLKLEEGMYIKEDIKDFDDNIIIKDGKRLDSKLISKIVDLGMSRVKIDDTEIRKINNFLKVNKYISFELKNTSIEFIKKNLILNEKDYKNILKLNISILNSLLEDETFVKILRALKRVDEYTFYHSINVYVYSLMIGYFSRIINDEIKDLAIGSLLHDVGKIKIEKEYLKKSAYYSNKELEKIKVHTIIGYKLISKCAYSKNVSDIVLNHHERLDGTGYLKEKKELSELVLITAVADEFDLLSNDRIKKRSLNAHTALKEMENGNQKFNDRHIKILKDHTSNYLEGSTVILNNNSIAIVIKKNSKSPNFPIVRIIKNENNKKEKAYEVDLSKREDLKIKKIID